MKADQCQPIFAPQRIESSRLCNRMGGIDGWMMTDHSRYDGAPRARWLAELAAALDEAARLAAHVEDEAGGAAIRAHIAEVRSEVEQARKGRFSGVERKPPKRSETSQWWGK